MRRGGQGNAFGLGGAAAGGAAANVRVPPPGLGFRVQSLGFWVRSSGLRVQSLGFRV